MNRSSAFRLSLLPTLAALAMPLTAQTSVITSCVSKLSGVSRIVSAASACNATVETVVQWNMQGVPGAPGLVYRGAYNGSTAYQKGDVITYSGSAYVALGNAGGFPPTSSLNQTAHEWDLLVPQGATGAIGLPGRQGATGAPGVAGPAGPQGPTGATGAGSNLYYTVNTYYSRPKLSAGKFNRFVEICPNQERAVSSTCGYGNGSVAGETYDIVVNFAGLDIRDNQNSDGSPHASDCLLNNNSLLGDRDIVSGVSCLATTAGLPAQQVPTVIKSCTYDPATQQPCTEADAVVTDPLAALKQTASTTTDSATTANAAATNAEATASTTAAPGKKATQQRVTLWFRN